MCTKKRKGFLREGVRARFQAFADFTKTKNPEAHRSTRGAAANGSSGSVRDEIGREGLRASDRAEGRVGREPGRERARRVAMTTP